MMFSYDQNQETSPVCFSLAPRVQEQILPILNILG